MPKERREAIADEVERMAETEKMYLDMAIIPAKKRPRNDEAVGTKMSNSAVKKALKEIREDLGLPDFRHKMWKEVKKWT